MNDKTTDCCNNCKNGNHEECSDFGGFQFITIFEDGIEVNEDIKDNV